MSDYITKEGIMDSIGELPEEFVLEAEYTEEELKRLNAPGGGKTAAGPAVVTETSDKKTHPMQDWFQTSPDAEDDEREMKPVEVPKPKTAAVVWSVVGVALAAAAILLLVLLWNPDRRGVVTTSEEATTEEVTEAATEATTEAATEVATEATTEEPAT